MVSFDLSSTYLKNSIDAGRKLLDDGLRQAKDGLQQAKNDGLRQVKKIPLSSELAKILPKGTNDLGNPIRLVKLVGDYGSDYLLGKLEANKRSSLKKILQSDDAFNQEVVKQTEKLLGKSSGQPKYWSDLLPGAMPYFKDVAVLEQIQEHLQCIQGTACDAELKCSIKMAQRDLSVEIVRRAMTAIFNESMQSLFPSLRYTDDESVVTVTDQVAGAIADFLNKKSASLPSHTFETLPDTSLKSLNSWIEKELTKPSCQYFKPLPDASLGSLNSWIEKQLTEFSCQYIKRLKDLHPYVHQHHNLWILEKHAEEKVQAYKAASDELASAIRTGESKEKIESYKTQWLKSQTLLEKALTDFFGAYACVYFKFTKNNSSSEPDRLTAFREEMFSERAIRKLQKNHKIYGRLQALFNKNAEDNSNNTSSTWSEGSPLSRFIKQEIKVARSHIDPTLFDQISEIRLQQDIHTLSNTDESSINEAPTANAPEVHVKENLPAHAPNSQPVPAESDTSQTVLQAVQHTLRALGTFSVKMGLAPIKAILACWKAFYRLLGKVFAVVSPKQDTQKASAAPEVEEDPQRLANAAKMITFAESKFERYATSKISIPVSLLPINKNIKISKKFLRDVNKDLIHSISINGKKYDLPNEDSKLLGYKKLGYAEYIVPCQLYDFCIGQNGFAEDEFLYISGFLSEFLFFIEHYLLSWSGNSPRPHNIFPQCEKISSFSIKRLPNHAFELVIDFQRNDDSSFIVCPMALEIDIKNKKVTIKKVTSLDENSTLPEALVLFHKHWFEQASRITDNHHTNSSHTLSDTDGEVPGSAEKLEEFESMIPRPVTIISRTA